MMSTSGGLHWDEVFQIQVRKRLVCDAILYQTIHHFTKTGSGQTYRESTQHGAVFSLYSTAAASTRALYSSRTGGSGRASTMAAPSPRIIRCANRRFPFGFLDKSDDVLPRQARGKRSRACSREGVSHHLYCSPTGRNASCLQRTKPSCCSSCPGVALTVETDRADSNGDEKVCPAACLRQLYW